MQDFNNTMLRDARLIVGSPENYVDDPTQFATAWAAMKAGRGQGFDPARLHPQHLIDRPAPAPEPIDQTLVRVGEKVREVIASKGYQVQPKHAA
jgi:hypothetical protein